MDTFDKMADIIYDDDLSKNEIAEYLRGEFMQYDLTTNGGKGCNDAWIPFDRFNKPIESTRANMLVYLVTGGEAVFSAFFIDGMFSMSEHTFDNITHWMPMPKPPVIV